MSAPAEIEAAEVSPHTHPWLRAYPAGISWAAPLPSGNLTDLFEQAVAAHGDRPCVSFFGRRWTYRQVSDLVDRAAGGLRRLGVQRGDRVGLCLPNTPYAVIAFYAVLRAGATVVNFSPLSVRDDLLKQAIDSGATILFGIDLEPSFTRLLSLLGEGPVSRLIACSFADCLPSAKRALFKLTQRRMCAPVPRADARVLTFAGLIDGPPIADPVDAAPGDLAVLQYTGGTTGTPKGVMLSHANLVANAQQVTAWFPHAVKGQEKVLAVLPLFHVFALTTAMNVPIAMGGEIILLPRYEYRWVVSALRQRRPSIFPGVPTLFKALLEKGITAADLASVKVCISGGAPLPAEIKRAFNARSPCVLVEGYGLTESSPVCFCNPVDGPGREGTIGLPVPGVEARICDIERPEMVFPVGQRGELQVRGPNVMRGYFNRPEESAAVLSADGWLRTGDVGEMDAEGYVTLVDRIKDLIICGGFNVYPRHVEEAIYRHPDVVAATVLGIPDPYRGESVAAFVQRRPGSTLDEAGLMAFLKDKLSPVEMPRLIEMRAELPRTMVGKLSRKELREELLTRGDTPNA
jgi:long-chain acyl-CoA synthetase